MYLYVATLLGEKKNEYHRGKLLSLSPRPLLDIFVALPRDPRCSRFLSCFLGDFQRPRGTEPRTVRWPTAWPPSRQEAPFQSRQGWCRGGWGKAFFRGGLLMNGHRDFTHSCQSLVHEQPTPCMRRGENALPGLPPLPSRGLNPSRVIATDPARLLPPPPQTHKPKNVSSGVKFHFQRHDPLKLSRLPSSLTQIACRPGLGWQEPSLCPPIPPQLASLPKPIPRSQVLTTRRPLALQARPPTSRNTEALSSQPMALMEEVGKGK